MYKYEIILYWSNEDDAFVAEVPELPGCMAHGRTQETALRGDQRGHAPVDRDGPRGRRAGAGTER